MSGGAGSAGGIGAGNAARVYLNALHALVGG